MKTILFLSNHFLTLYTYRQELIHELIRRGHKIYISTPESEDNQYWIDLGCTVINTEIDKRGISPYKDAKLILSYYRIIKRVKPDLVLSFTIKPNIYGSLVSNWLGIKQICNITGTGEIFLRNRFIVWIVKMLYRMSVKHAYKVFFQNQDNRDFFVDNRLIKNNYEMIPGSGVNLQKYTYSEPFESPLRFIFIGRIIKIKGIEEYLRAAEAIKKEYPDTTFYIAGLIEDEKYQPIIDQYEKQGIVTYLGYQSNIKDWIEKCHCTILPSRGGEGIPNVLLETSAAGRICIGSNIAGTKDVIVDGVTGYLFEAGDVDDLVAQIKKVVNMNQEQRVYMRKVGREQVVSKFDRGIVVEKYISELEG